MFAMCANSYCSPRTERGVQTSNGSDETQSEQTWEALCPHCNVHVLKARIVLCLGKWMEQRQAQRNRTALSRPWQRCCALQSLRLAVRLRTRFRLADRR